MDGTADLSIPCWHIQLSSCYKAYCLRRSKRDGIIMFDSDHSLGLIFSNVLRFVFPRNDVQTVCRNEPSRWADKNRMLIPCNDIIQLDFQMALTPFVLFECHS